MVLIKDTGVRTGEEGHKGSGIHKPPSHSDKSKCTLAYIASLFKPKGGHEGSSVLQGEIMKRKAPKYTIRKAV